MRRSFRVILGLAAVGALLLAVPVAMIAPAFLGNAPLPAAATDLGGGVTLVPDVYVAAYLVDAGPGTIALIDCGIGGDPVQAALAQRGLDTDAVRAIFLTHGHADHLGGCAAFPRAEIYALAPELDMIEGRAAPKSPLGRIMGATDSGVRVAHPVHDGDVVRIGDTDVRVYATPGHTAGSAVYEAHGVVFLGDTSRSTPDGRVKTAPWFFSDDLAENDLSLESLAGRLADEGVAVRTLAFSHTGPLEALAPLTAFADQARAAR